MRGEIKELHQKLKTTAVYVTHDQIEAMTLAHRVAVMNRGVIEQLAASESVLTHDEKELGVALVDIGGGTADLAIFERGSLWHTGVVAVGGDHFTSDIAVGLRTPIPDAEKVKRKNGCALSSMVNKDETIEVPWGHAIPVAEVEKKLDADAGISAVFGTHSETSTGTLHDAQAFARATRARKRLLVLDAITSLGVHPLPQDEWGVDVVVTGSQKGLMSPPGIATVSLAPWALDAIEGERAPRFYWDLRKARKSLPLGESAFTPAVSLVFAVGEALTMMKEEGLAQVHTRHRRLGAAVRAGAQAIGWTLFSKSPADSVTALEPPAGMDAGAVVKRLREAHGITVAGGQDHTKGKMLRIGHMGAYDLSDVHVVLAALEECTQALGRPGSGAIETARRAWESA